MSGLYELFMLLLPLILTGGVITSLVSRFIPVIMARMHKNMNKNKIIKFYKNYLKAPEVFAVVQPRLKDFFDNKEWVSCECKSCGYIKKYTARASLKQPHDNTAVVG